MMARVTLADDTSSELTLVVNGTAHIGSLSFETEDKKLNETEAVAFIRPHELQVYRDEPPSSSFKAKVVHIQPIGSVVRLELIREEDDSHQSLEVELTRERYRELNLHKNDIVFLTVNRLHVFPPDYSI